MVDGNVARHLYRQPGAVDLPAGFLPLTLIGIVHRAQSAVDTGDCHVAAAENPHTVLHLRAGNQRDHRIRVAEVPAVMGGIADQSARHAGELESIGAGRAAAGDTEYIFRAACRDLRIGVVFSRLQNHIAVDLQHHIAVF